VNYVDLISIIRDLFPSGRFNSSQNSNTLQMKEFTSIKR
jgi:hypothetical protein